ncbi:MAG TPA: metallophosphoesterase, partial [Chryseolinea sp.]|nr:metallophosphoesterase [Chryseolinea sp.]
MAKSFLFSIFLLLAYVVYAQPQIDLVTCTLFFVGDAGEPFIIDDPLGRALRDRVKNSGSNTMVVFLGDNIYPKGMPGPHERDRAMAEKIIQAQVDWIKDLDAEGIFIPGNHDWLRGRKRGWEYITNQQRWFDSLNNKKITLWPKDGCPGPIEIPLNDQTTLVILDTQWFLHPWNKPAEESECDAKSPADVLIFLEDIFIRNPTKRIVVAGHHPLITYGEHGGTSILKDHIFPLTSVRPKLYIPLPILGSFYPLYRKWFGDIQDTSHPLYQEMIKALGNTLAEHPGSIYVSGHEHSLQAIVKDSTYFIVSGSGAKTTNVKKKKYSRFAASVTGFVKAEIFKSGRVKLEYFQVDVDFPNGKTIYTDSLPPQLNLQPIPPSVGNLDFSNKIVRVKASDQYQAGNGKQKIFGKNYREAWAQEIDVPVFDLAREQGGLKILQKGGGMQTLSLRMEDSSGREFVIRSIEKFPEKAVPQMFRKTFIQ